jgi:hypothetical protein
MINIVVPMAGLGSRFAIAGFEKPKPFIDVFGKPMIERVMENIHLPDARFILIGRKEHFEQEVLLIEQIKLRYPDTIFIGLDKLTEGTACTVLFAKEYIDNENPLLIANSDQLVDIEPVGGGKNGSCLWAPEWLGVNASHPAAQSYYDAVVDKLIELGADFIKADCFFCRPCYNDEMLLFTNAVKRREESLVLYYSPGGGALARPDDGRVRRL